MNYLRMFGGTALDSVTGPVAGRAAQRHRVALLTLLATTRRLYRSRDQLITLLWPDNDAERGRKLLSDSIYRINHALGGDVVAATGDDLRLNRALISCDVAELEAASEAQQYARVVELYRGPFLDGFYVPGSPDFDQWMDAEREYYLRLASKAHESLAIAASDDGRINDAVEWWQKLSVLVPDDSRVAMQLMRALEAAGNPAGALRQARVHATALREMVGVEPGRDIVELTTRISRNSVRVNDSVATVAVLPFSSASDDDGNSYFADGLSEEIIFLLSRMPGLQVASRTSSFAYRGLRIDIREIARRLNVSRIVEGAVRRSGDRLRVSVQLIDASNGFQIWSDSFDGNSAEIFEIQTNIANALSDRLLPQGGATRTNVPFINQRVAADPQTYDYYLQARHQWHRRTEESIGTAIGLLEKVVARDPSYARAWVGLADAFAVMASHDYIAPHDAFPRAEAAARRALQLDGTLAAPYATIGYVDTYYHWNWSQAESRFRRALELEPTSSTTLQWYANLLTARGQFAEAEVTMRRAAELDPLSMIAHAAIGWVMMFANQANRAIQHLYGALQLDPTYCLTHYWMALSLLRNGQARESIRYMQQTLKLAIGPKHASAHALSGLARAHATAGDRDVALGYLAQLLDQERSGRYIPSFQMGKVYQTLGDIPNALARFERAYHERAHSMAYLRVDPQLWPLMREARFRNLLANVESISLGESPTAAASAVSSARALRQ